MAKAILDLTHSMEIKKVGIIAVAALKDVFDVMASKFPAALELQGLGDDVFIALGLRLSHLLDNQEHKESSVAAVTEAAPEAKALASQPVVSSSDA